MKTLVRVTVSDCTGVLDSKKVGAKQFSFQSELAVVDDNPRNKIQ